MDNRHTPVDSTPVWDPGYWKDRLHSTPRDKPHYAIYVCHRSVWREIERRHKAVLHDAISPADSVLDVGCAWGRLVDMLPNWWHGDYLGVDISPEFISIARHKYPKRTFTVGDIRNLALTRDYDVAVLIAVRDMMDRYYGPGAWASLERQLRLRCGRLICLEYEVLEKEFVE